MHSPVLFRTNAGLSLAAASPTLTPAQLRNQLWIDGIDRVHVIGAGAGSREPLPADIVLTDPLHGYCAGVGQCVDNGTNSPTTNNPPVNFGFTISPGPQTGIVLIDVLVPNNFPEYTNPLSG